MLKSYLKRIYEITNRGDAREESYYSALEALLKEYTGRTDIPVCPGRNIQITTLPKKTEAGNPDFRIWDGTQHIVGYIEAKAPTVEYLDQTETTEQLKHYLHTFPNLILTNFFEFRLYRNGNLIDKVLIARPFIVHKLKTIPPAEKESDFLKLLEKFFSFSLPRVYDAKTLAIELAKRTRFLKDEVVAQELKRVGQTFLSDNKMSVLHGFYEAFRKYLIGGLSKEEFADLYSQTITYGLFAARTRLENGFNRKLAYDNIPHTIGILRDVFRFISLEDLPQQMEWTVDDISEVLAVTDVKNILHQYFHEGKGKDPIVHFYETFLAEYDPQTREKRGVYYTPEPVVSYIVRSLHHILKEHFNRTDGFASESVTVLDPAAGTLTFLADAAKLAVEEFVFKYGGGGKENFIKEHILKHFYAFELMMAPYAVGHLKMSFLLEELGYRLQKDDRFRLFLTNTLEMEELAQTEFPGMASLSEESHLAGKVKKEQPILVILGNPPYSGISANVGKWIDDLLKKGYVRSDGSKDDGYYRVDGEPLGERKLWLQDDYVKFIRFGQWKIDQAGEGVLGFITNHSYLDNPTFRGMRQSLMNSFNEIYILDLHGNSLKKEKCPDGSKDENVFDIRQGVAIALFVKKKVGQTFLSDHDQLQITRRHLPHWTLKDATYFVTFRTHQQVGQSDKNNQQTRMPEEPQTGMSVLLSIEEQKLVLEHIREGDGNFYTLIAVVVMPDHVHILLIPKEGYDLSRIMKGIKGVSAKKINLKRRETDKNVCSTGSIWQDESYDRIVRDEKELKEKIAYMFNNPVKEGLTDDPLNYYGWYYNEGFDKQDRQDEEDRQECLSHYVYHSEIWGLREEKYAQLLKDDIKTTKWKKLNPTSPYYFFVPREERGRVIYEKYLKITDIFPVNVTGIVTARDKFVIDYNRQSLKVKIRTFIDEKNTDDYIKQFLKGILGRKEIRDVENYAWRVSKARQELRKVEKLEDYFTKILYRPFDIREIFFHDSVVWRTRKEVMRHMMQENFGLITPKQFKEEPGAFVTRDITAHKTVSAYDINYLFPLYLYPDIDKKDLFNHTVGQTFLSDKKRKPNISPKLFTALSEIYKKEPTPEEIFYYIYAVLYSNTYRTRYTEFLKIDFPRIPFTKDYKLFSKMAEYGKRLVDLHLLKSSELDPPVAKFQGKGDERVGKLRYEEKEMRLYVSQSQYFEGVTKEVWQYQIGGYQVCHKWLKDRKGRRLSLDDIKHYCKIVTSLEKTIEIQRAIDDIYPEAEKETVESKK